MIWTDNPVRDAERYSAHLEEDAKRFPECECCGHRIFEDRYYEIYGELLCFDCMRASYERKTEDYLERGYDGI